MKNWGKITIGAVALMAWTCGIATAGETVSYTGSGRYTAHKLNMTLGNGDVVVSARSQGPATISTNPPMLLEAKCLGLGMLAADDSYSNDLFCTFRANDKDSFDIKGKSGPKGAVGEVIGGSGRWQGAKGSIKAKRTAQGDDWGEYTFEMKVTTP